MTEVDLTLYKIKDMYTGLLVKASTVEQLREWLVEKQVTKTEMFYKTVDGLLDAFESGEDIRWHAAANGLEIAPKKKTRRKAK